MTDLTRSGSREYDEKAHDRVIATFTHLCSIGAAPVQAEDLARMCGMGGRTVRQILADADGIEFLLAGSDDGYAIAEFAEQAESFTRRIKAQAFTMMERVRRREDAQEKLFRRQPVLF